MPLPKLVALVGDEAPADVQEAARALRHVSRAVRQHRGGPARHHREALDLLSRGDGLPPDLRPGQRQPPLQSSGRIRLHLRDHLLAVQAAAVRGRRSDPALHRRLPSRSASSGPTTRSGPPTRWTCRSRTWCTTMAAPRTWSASATWLADARHHAGGTVQRVGVLQLRPRLHRRPEGCSAGGGAQTSPGLRHRRR